MTRCRSAVPGDALTVSLERWNSNAPVPFRIDLEEWFFTDDGCAFDLGVGWLRPFACGRIRDADEDHVPVRSGPASPLAVARDPLLLRAGADVAVDQRVGHPSAAGPSAFLMKNDVADHMHPAERHSLGDGPLHGAVGGCDGEALNRAPERAGSVVAREAGIRVDVADDVDSVGCRAEADDFCVEADGDVDVVLARQEEQSVTGRTELTVLLNRVDLVNLGLDVGRGHRGLEEQHVGPEIRMPPFCCLSTSQERH